MAANAETFKVVFSDFADLSDTKVDYWLTLAIEELSAACLVECLGARLDHATYLLTAHMLSKAGANNDEAASGEIASEKAGDLALTYVSPDYSNPDWRSPFMSTQYGIEYVRIMSACVLTVMVI